MKTFIETIIKKVFGSKLQKLENDLNYALTKVDKLETELIESEQAIIILSESIRSLALKITTLEQELINNKVLDEKPSDIIYN